MRWWFIQQTVLSYDSEVGIETAAVSISETLPLRLPQCPTDPQSRFVSSHFLVLAKDGWHNPSQRRRDDLSTTHPALERK